MFMQKGTSVHIFHFWDRTFVTFLLIPFFLLKGKIHTWLGLHNVKKFIFQVVPIYDPAYVKLLILRLILCRQNYPLYSMLHSFGFK